VLPFAAAHPSPDDISEIITFKDYVGIFWSNQVRGEFDWAVHHVGTPPSAWTLSVVERGSSISDDHLDAKSLKTDPRGRVYVVAKTSLNDKSRDATLPLVQLFVFEPATRSWVIHTVATIGDCATRPTLVLDQAHTLHVYFTAPPSGCNFSGTGGTIYEKETSMDQPSFPSGRGVPIMQDSRSQNLNDAASVKQSQATDSAVTARTGLVVVATNDETKSYWHSYESIGRPQS
jgi:hypothetical protein